ncbi:hypothetical protein D3C81_1506110 [compost metagenome]
MQRGQHGVECLQDTGDLRLAGFIGQHPVGDALGTQVLDQIIDLANLAELLRARNGVVQGPPAAGGSGHGEQQYHGKTQSELGADADIANPAVEVAEHGKSPSS